MGNVYFIGGLRRVRHLFKGGVYSRAAFNKVNMVLVLHPARSIIMVYAPAAGCMVILM